MVFMIKNKLIHGSKSLRDRNNIMQEAMINKAKFYSSLGFHKRAERLIEILETLKKRTEK
jgi:hypothetical protein